jgi:hypothetical protein
LTQTKNRAKKKEQKSEGTKAKKATEKKAM